MEDWETYQKNKKERKIEALDDVLMLVERQEDISEDDLQFQYGLIEDLRNAYRDGRLL